MRKISSISLSTTLANRQKLGTEPIRTVLRPCLVRRRKTRRSFSYFIMTKISQRNLIRLRIPKRTSKFPKIVILKYQYLLITKRKAHK